MIRPVPSAPVVGTDPEFHPGESLGWLSFQALENEEDRLESLRLFYVATTRARDHLIISAGLETEPEMDDPVGQSLAGLGSCSRLSACNPRPASHAFQLLIERFDWRTGRNLAKLPDGWPEPRVEAVVTTSPKAEDTRRRPAVGRRLEEIRQAIQSTPLAVDRQVRRPPAPPSLIDLDPQPELPSRSDRLRRLIRGTIVEPSLLRGDPLDQVCALVGVRQAPAASSTLIALAVHSLESWQDGAVFQELRNASRSRKAIERALRWVLPWVLELETSCLIRGFCDAVYRDRQGRWRPVIVCTDPLDHDTAHLRLMLSELAVSRCGLAPGGPAWWVRWARTAHSSLTFTFAPPSRCIEQAVSRWLKQYGRPVERLSQRFR